MYNVLSDIYKDPLLSRCLGFKGGTALYFLYGLPRFSTDLDFDLLDKNNSERAYTSLRVILQKYGTLKDEASKHNTLFFLLSYGERDHNLKVEVSLLTFPNEYEIQSLYGLSVRTLKQAYMFAHKLCALTDRKKIAARDLYDIYFLLSKGWEINEEIVRLRTKKDIKGYLSEVVDLVKTRVTSKQLLPDLGEVLDDKGKQWVKEHLLDELSALLQLRIGGNY